jgi:hypothetical protein
VVMGVCLKRDYLPRFARGMGLPVVWARGAPTTVVTSSGFEAHFCYCAP